MIRLTMHALGCGLMAIAVVVGTPLEGRAASAVKQCVRSCKQDRRECRRKFKQQRSALKRACSALAPGQEVKACKKIQQQAFKANKRQCSQLFRDLCKPCCREGGADCGAGLNSSVVSPGEGVTSDEAGDGATAADIVELTIESPNAGRVAVVKTHQSAPPPSGFVPLGVEFLVAAPEATPSEPLTLIFDVDTTQVPVNDVALEIFRDGVLVAPCLRGSANASPDPCVARRQRLESGDARITARASMASSWTVATRTCGNGTREAGEACDPPGGIGDCPGCQACLADCVCRPVPTETCEPNAAGGPDLAGVILTKGLDLDFGWTGLGHNQEFSVGARVFFACLEDCDTSSNAKCSGIGRTGPGTFNGVEASSPFPVIIEDIAVCIRNSFADDILVREIDLATGEMEFHVRLTTSAFLTGNKERPCPTCSGSSVGARGTCRAGPNVGLSCITEAIDPEFGNTSSDCPPSGANFSGALDIMFDPTTGTSTLPARPPFFCSGGVCQCPGQTKVNECDDTRACDLSNCPEPAPGEERLGIDHACCTNGAEINSCFFGDITRNGAPAPFAPAWPGPTYPKFSTSGRIAGSFCVPPTNSATINVPSGLPGPGAFVFGVDTCVDFSP